MFTNLVNRCIALAHHPAQWRFFTTITLRKPGKPSYLIPKAYRPIALEDTSSKLVESAVARRLASLAEEQGLLPPNHFGGRPNRCTTDAVLHLTQRIKDSWRKGHVASVLYLDISSTRVTLDLPPLAQLRRLTHFGLGHVTSRAAHGVELVHLLAPVLAGPALQVLLVQVVLQHESHVSKSEVWAALAGLRDPRIRAREEPLTPDEWAHAARYGLDWWLAADSVWLADAE